MLADGPADLVKAAGWVTSKVHCTELRFHKKNPCSWRMFIPTEDPRIWSMLNGEGGPYFFLYSYILSPISAFYRPWTPHRCHLLCGIWQENHICHLWPDGISDLFLGIGCALVQPNGMALSRCIPRESRDPVPGAPVGWHACWANRCGQGHQGYCGSCPCLC